MSNQPLSVVVRPPILLRAYGIVFGLAWSVFFSAILLRGVLREGADASLLVVVPFAAVGPFAVAGSLRARVVADSGGLHVVNYLRVHRYPAASIDRFVSHAPNGLPASWTATIAVLLDDGRLIDLHATSRGRFGAAGRDERLIQLQGWLTAQKSEAERQDRSS